MEQKENLRATIAQIFLCAARCISTILNVSAVRSLRGNSSLLHLVGEDQEKRVLTSKQCRQGGKQRLEGVSDGRRYFFRPCKDHFRKLTGSPPARSLTPWIFITVETTKEDVGVGEQEGTGLTSSGTVQSFRAGNQMDLILWQASRGRCVISPNTNESFF